jgi:hypothetical protein
MAYEAHSIGLIYDGLEYLGGKEFAWGKTPTLGEKAETGKDV